MQGILILVVNLVIVVIYDLVIVVNFYKHYVDYVEVS